MNKKEFIHKITSKSRTLNLFDKSVEKCIHLFLDKIVDRTVDYRLISIKKLEFEVISTKENALSKKENKLIVNNDKNHGVNYDVVLTKENTNKIKQSTKLYRNVD